MAEAYWHENGKWHHGLPAEYFRNPGKVVSIVGGGGKSSLMYHLAKEYNRRGLKTAVMTTTKIYRPETFCRTPAECESCWEEGYYAICGALNAEGKLGRPADEMLEWLIREADVILSEADGARRMPCKAPAEYEPVFLPQTDMVIGVMGMEVSGRSVEEICFRPERVCELLGCSTDHIMTAEDMVKILLSDRGTRKYADDLEYHIVLNKCDNEQRLQQAKHTALLLEQRGHLRTVITRLK